MAHRWGLRDGEASVSDDRANDTSGVAPQGRRRVLLLDTDLFFAVKVAETLKHAGYATRSTRRVSDFTEALAAERPEVALVNTAARGVDWRAAVAAARAAGVPLVAYGSHVDVETQEQGRQAGGARGGAQPQPAGRPAGGGGRTLRAPSPGGRAPGRAETGGG